MKLLVGQLHDRGRGSSACRSKAPPACSPARTRPSNGEWQYARNSVWAVKIGGGTDEIQRNVLAERVLGLPREMQVDRDTPFRDLLGRG